MNSAQARCASAAVASILAFATVGCQSTGSVPSAPSTLSRAVQTRAATLTLPPALQSPDTLIYKIRPQHLSLRSNDSKSGLAIYTKTGQLYSHGFHTLDGHYGGCSKHHSPLPFTWGMGYTKGTLNYVPFTAYSNGQRPGTICKAPFKFSFPPSQVYYKTLTVSIL
jgi:hypothetical protein